MATKITMFTKNNCPECFRAKMLLETCPVEIEIEERNIETDPIYRLILENELNSQSVPTFVVKDENDEVIDIVRGFHEGNLTTAIGL
ncbi:glutaredoxin family protein [Bacillus albus]|uniref:glutaredoxin family protein n=1 Tax=Bacillus albus TaxID=2026189 RepID=UPI003D248197